MVMPSEVRKTNRDTFEGEEKLSTARNTQLKWGNTCRDLRILETRMDKTKRSYTS
ncbi:hypothetical protein KLEB273_gp281 [Bacillus phage vB_BauM_KLEB27-3]|nr:hypothetical protein KLEB273_gp281 [Bacillus phage vB_BauM_KLEB27-3]